ncbi:hypothetical protein [Algihabitans albus]|nr:hypothetical protein [Algihabitans albus]
MSPAIFALSPTASLFLPGVVDRFAIRVVEAGALAVFSALIQ